MIERNGYLMVWVQEQRRYCYLHRVLMEGELGRALATDEHVHHKNGDKQDNRLDNLEVLSVGEHRREHILNGSTPFGQPGPRPHMRTGKYRACETCGTEFYVVPSKDARRFCSQKCDTARRVRNANGSFGPCTAGLPGGG